LASPLPARGFRLGDSGTHLAEWGNRTRKAGERVKPGEGCKFISQTFYENWRRKDAKIFVYFMKEEVFRS
jgi:hypothetical protein